MKKSRTLCFWAWNGDMNKRQIKEQLESFAEQGMGGVFAHSRAGLKIEYLGEEWFDAFAFSAQECERLGLDLYIYDEDGWPSGFAGGIVYQKDEEYLERYLHAQKFVYPYEDLPQNIVAVYKDLGDNFEFLSFNGDNLCEDYGEIVVVFAIFNPVYVDILNKDAMAYFRKVTHEEYKKRFGDKFGKVIKGIFTDEPHLSPNGIPWGKYIPSSFEKLNGYSVYEALPYTFYKVGDYQKYRYDFWKNISALMVESFSQPYHEWAKENSLDFTGHYTCEEGQVEQISTCGGVMPLYEYQGIIGIDALGNRLVASPAFKQAESVAWQLGNKKVLCETYACSGYDATFSDILYIWGYQASLGVNVPCLSISMYSIEGTRKRDYPVFFSHQMPWWNKFNQLSSAFDYINNRMLGSERESDLLLIHPKTSVWCEKGFGNLLEECVISSDFRRITESLLHLEKSFDYADEHLLKSHYRIEKDTIYLGKMRYNSILLPPLVNIEQSTMDILKEFALSGGKVVVLDRLPTHVDGRKSHVKFDFPHYELSSRTDMLRKYFVCEDELADIELIDRYTRRPALGFTTSRRIDENGKFMFVVNLSREEERKVRVRATGKKLIVKRTVAEKRIPLYSEYDVKADVTYADVVFDAQEVCFIDLEEFAETPKYKTISSTALNEFDITATENVLVVEKVRYKMDGGEFSPFQYCIFATPEFYSKIDKKKEPTLLTMEYCFTSEIEKIDGAYILVEDDACEVYFNGVKVEKAGVEIDYSLGKYVVGGLIKKGENVVTVIRKIKPWGSTFDLGEVFQTVTNVFSYEYYMENIYVKGDFDVKTFEPFTPGENCVWMSEKGAYITAKTEKKKADDFTVQGMPYFMGTVRLTKSLTIDKNAGERQFLAFDKPDFSVMKVTVNGRSIDGVGIAPYECDITDFVSDGENFIEIELFSTARNFFGPFHHIKGRHNEVGHTTFKGYVEFEDPVVFIELKDAKTTWTDESSFAPFGIKNFRLIIRGV